jgi:hypothetical protein
MSSLLIIPVPPVKLARAAWVRVIALLLVGLLAAVGLAFYGYQLYRLEAALNSYKQAAAEYQVRTEASNDVGQMEAVFNQYLLRGDRGVLQFMDLPRKNVEQLIQREDNGHRDPILENLVAEEKKWYEQTALPMIEARQKIPAGQPLPDHFFDQYLPVNKIGFLFASERAQSDATGTLQRSVMGAHWLWLPFPLAALLIIGVIVLAIGAMKNVSYLKQAAENPGEEEEDVPEPHEGQ